MKKMIALLVTLLSFSVFGQEQFAGSWSSSVNSINFYAESGTYNYQNCKTDLSIDVQVPSAAQKKLTIKNLKTTCSHPSFWDFNQSLPTTNFIIDTKTQVVSLESGMKVGTLSDSVLEIKYEQDGEIFFLDGKFNADGTLHFEWSLRSYETLNFDVVNNLKHQ